ncbi:MAG: VanZ family protein [Dysgonamonadaceae bacterium]|nr:VanZ family protein [Dysgonamonadaceae bacterium]
MKKYKISIALIIAILVLCFINVAPLPAAPISNFDKFVHLVMFLALSGAIFFDNTAYLKIQISIRQLFLASFLFPTLFSGAIELGQEYFTTTRSGDWWDFLFDGIGAFIGILVCLLINRRLRVAGS